MIKFKRLIRITVGLASSVLLLTFLGFYYISNQANQDDDREEIERIADHQQILSQQILKNILLILSENNLKDSSAVEELRNSLALFKKQQEFMERNVAAASPGNDAQAAVVQMILKQSQPFYKEIFETGNRILQGGFQLDTYNKADLKRINENEQKFVAKLSTISRITRIQQDEIGKQIYWINMAILGLLILGLAALAFMVITPIFKSSIEDYERMMIAKNKAEAAEMERSKMVTALTIRNKDLEQFAHIVSHNLRAPVANMMGAINVLNMPELCTEDKDVFLKGLEKNVNGLDGVIRDLNQILQLKLNTDESKEIVNFSDLVDDIRLSISNMDDKDITINCDFNELSSILTLRSYLYSIFYNLIMNSIKYRRVDVPCLIQISSYKRENLIGLVFKDNGMGMDLNNKKDQIFGLYKRLHPNIEGKGMGLFMVKMQIGILNGNISVNSEVNEGTEFVIEFNESAG